VIVRDQQDRAVVFLECDVRPIDRFQIQLVGRIERLSTREVFETRGGVLSAEQDLAGVYR